MPLPQPVGAAECGKAALCADPGAGQDDDIAKLAHTRSLQGSPSVRHRWEAGVAVFAGPTKLSLMARVRHRLLYVLSRSYRRIRAWLNDLATS